MPARAAAPAETAGPYPGDGSNGPNVLIESGVVRGDIRASFGTYTVRAEGVPMTIELTLKDLSKNCAAGILPRRLISWLPGQRCRTLTAWNYYAT